ncbi:hypothetical protein [Streptomyces sp. CA-106131]|uniref:hypothetical protein n=1 Tax=Streptomyces sp. CA-106131 TaxID=3240045 RepID=UPI003D8FC632
MAPPTRTTAADPPAAERPVPLDYGPDGIGVNALVVGLVNTPLIVEGPRPK